MVLIATPKKQLWTSSITFDLSGWFDDAPAHPTILAPSPTCYFSLSPFHHSISHYPIHHSHCHHHHLPNPTSPTLLVHFVLPGAAIPQFGSKMNGYSKMGVSTGITTKLSSTDFSDLTFSLEPKEPTPVEAGVKIHDQRNGVILGRNCGSASQRFRDNGTTSLQNMVRRAFSMRKPSSAAGGYWRMHDTGDGDGEFVEQEQQQQEEVRSSRKKKGKLLRACKKLLGI
ncbi:hypothetical protein GW17_00013144 [Ensete ventricosum]|nr:hypothetical protein GW17_00013144 [Ensete ventricosum]